MEVSSTSMKVASVTVMAMIQGFTAGRQASASALFNVVAPALIARIQTLGSTDIPGRR